MFTTFGHSSAREIAGNGENPCRRGPMYRKKQRRQVQFECFHLSFARKLRSDNRWVRLAKLVPRAEIEGRYAEVFTERIGTPAISASGRGESDHQGEARAERRGVVRPPELGCLPRARGSPYHVLRPAVADSGPIRKACTWMRSIALGRTGRSPSQASWQREPMSHRSASLWRS